MLSAVIPSERSQPAVPLAGQLAHQRFVRPGPLVLGTALLKSPTRAADRDRTVSRRSKPSSRTALMGEQPNPWDLLRTEVRCPIQPEWYFKIDSTRTSVPASQSPTYPTQTEPSTNVKL